MMTVRRSLPKLLWAMSRRRTFYVLGAGTSYGLLPVTQKMRRLIEDEYHSIGVYPATTAPHSPLFERVIGRVSLYDDDARNILLRHMPPGALDFLAQRALWRPRDGGIPAQYAVFNVLGAPATLFNFNLDGLAQLYCGHRHVVLEPHGHIDRVWFDGANYGDLLESTVVYELSVPHLTPKLLPSPEPQNIVESDSYTMARKLFKLSPAMIIIGYSFGRRDSGFDDIHSLEYFVDLLKNLPRPAFVLSPSPDEIVEVLRERLSSPNVFGLSVRWEIFSELILAATDLAGLNPCWCDRQIEKLIYSYEKALDKQ